MHHKQQTERLAKYTNPCAYRDCFNYMYTQYISSAFLIMVIYVNNATAECDIYILIHIGCLTTPQLILSTSPYHMNTMQLIRTQYYPLLLLLLHCQMKALCNLNN